MAGRAWALPRALAAAGLTYAAPCAHAASEHADAVPWPLVSLPRRARCTIPGALVASGRATCFLPANPVPSRPAARSEPFTCPALCKTARAVPAASSCDASHAASHAMAWHAVYAPTAAWARAGGRGAVDAGRLSASVARRDGPAPAACTDPAGRSDAAVPVPTGAMARTAAHGAAARAECVVCAGSQHAGRVYDALAYAAGHDRAASAASACAAPRRAHGPRPVACRVDSRGARAGGATGAASASPGSRACASESLGPADAHGPRAQRQHVLPPEAHDADGRCRGWQ